MISKLQAWIYTEATEAMTLAFVVVALRHLPKFPIDFKIFQWKCPSQNENGPALSKIKLQALNLSATAMAISRLAFTVSKASNIKYQLSPEDSHSILIETSHFQNHRDS